MNEYEHVEPARVHVVNAHELTRPKARKRLEVTCYTVVLGTGTNAVQELLPLDETREFAMVQAIDNDVVVCHTSAQAQGAANSTSGLPNPSGYLLPKANTGPTPIHGTNRVLVTSQANAGRISVMAYQRV